MCLALYERVVICSSGTHSVYQPTTSCAEIPMPRSPPKITNLAEILPTLVLEIKTI